MLQIGLSLFSGRDCVFDRDGAPSQTSDLRKNEPHPVAPLRAGFEFREHSLKDRSLSEHEAFEMEWIDRSGRRLRALGAHGILERVMQSRVYCTCRKVQRQRCGYRIHSKG